MDRSDHMLKFTLGIYSVFHPIDQPISHSLHFLMIVWMYQETNAWKILRPVGDFCAAKRCAPSIFRDFRYRIIDLKALNNFNKYNEPSFDLE